MITEPLSFSGTLTLQDSLDLNRYHFRCVLRWPIRLLMAVFSLLIATVVVFVGIKAGFSGFSFFVLALCSYYPFGWLLHHRLAVSWRYRRHRDQFIEHTATFTNDDISTSSVHTDLRLNWDRLASVVSTPRGLLFLVPPHTVWFWLPQRLFNGNNHKETILELATEHKIPIRRMA